MSACNVGNRTIFCDDNIDILPAINSDCIDLIYLDPPFNKNKKFTAPIGTSAEGASFKDIFREDDLEDEWLLTIEEDEPDLFHYLNGIKGVGKPYNFAYLAYMAVRLIECRRILKQDGSVYLHCDPTMSHYLKTTMDCVFGEENFRNEIAWCYRGGGVPKYDFARKHDIIFRYSMNKTPIFNVDDVRIPYSDDVIASHPSRYDKSYRTNKVYEGYKPNERGKHPEDWWTIQPLMPSDKKERLGYPTQKPLALLNRIILASSNEGDVVLDPFCGCATTCIAAEQLSRKWIGIDVSVKAYELVQERLAKETASLGESEVIVDLKTDPPKRTDQDEDYREHKFVYVISHPNYPGEYKVGIAKNWKSRLNSYQTSDPERQYKIEFKMETPWFRETERYIHDKFDNKHEWVTGNKDDIINEIRSYKPA